MHYELLPNSSCGGKGEPGFWIWTLKSCVGLYRERRFQTFQRKATEAVFWNISDDRPSKSEFVGEEEIYWDYIDNGKIFFQENVMFEYVFGDMLEFFLSEVTHL